MDANEIHDRGAWDAALLDLPNPHVLQSWTWGEFKSRHGWRATHLLFREGERTVAAALVLERKVPGLSKLPLVPSSILYVPKGPTLDWSDGGLANRVLAELESMARRRRSLFVKIDPDAYYLGAAPGYSPRPAIAGELSDLLGARGWRFSDDQIQYRNTVLLDLACPEDELLAAMKSKTRYNVRLAERRGVTIRQGGARDLDGFYELYSDTSERDGFLIRPYGYYRDGWSSFLEAGQAHLLLADVGGEMVAGLMLLTFGPTAWYIYGASSNRHRQHMPNQLLQWEAIRQAKAAGCTLYDLWGAPDNLDESDPMWGVVRFKLGLGGQLARGLGAWDYPTSRAAYRLYSGFMPRYLDWMRKRK